MSVQGLEFDKPKLVAGGHEQKAIVNTPSGNQPVNAPTVEDIKRIAKGEAEESSATEWEKSVKDHVNYNATADSVDIDTNLGVDGDIQSTQKVLATEGIVADTLYGFDDSSVETLDLMEGNRTFRHELQIELEIDEDDYYLYIGITNSSSEEINTDFRLANVSHECTFVSGMLYNSTSEESVIVLVELVNRTEVSVRYVDGTTASGTFVAVEDIVTQC